MFAAVCQCSAIALFKRISQACRSSLFAQVTVRSLSNNCRIRTSQTPRRNLPPVRRRLARLQSGPGKTSLVILKLLSPLMSALSSDRRGCQVEPRGFEPLTSAVQRRILKFANVRRCSKIPANKHILSYKLSWLFAVVRPGWCQIGVNCRRSSLSGRYWERTSDLCRVKSVR